MPTFKKNDKNNIKKNKIAGEYNWSSTRVPSYCDRVLVRNNTSHSISRTKYQPISYKLADGSD